MALKEICPAYVVLAHMLTPTIAVFKWDGEKKAGVLRKTGEGNYTIDGLEDEVVLHFVNNTTVFFNRRHVSDLHVFIYIDE